MLSLEMAPPTVRRALWLIGVPIAIGAALSARYGGKLPYIILGLVLPGLLLGGIAFRRNWARLIFAILFVISLPSSVVMSIRQAPISPLHVALWLVLVILEGTGVVLLFLPQSAAWYHRGSAA